MIFSLPSLGIIILVFLLYYFLPKKIRWVALLFASFGVSFASNSFRSFLVMLFSLLFVYFCSIMIENSKEEIKGLYLFIGTVVSLFGVFSLKTFSQHFMGITGVVAPLGISYYSFAMIGYMADIKRGLCKAEKNPFKFFLLVSFFPCLVSGPIIRITKVRDSIILGHDFNAKKVVFGIERFLFGLFKKLVVSDRIAIVVNLIFENYEAYSGFFSLLAILCFPIQIYTDFSGSIDMIMGISEMFGVDLPENFSLPFLAENIEEFWRKWHITLGEWLRDYVFYPILLTRPSMFLAKMLYKPFGKKRAKKTVTWIASLITWFLVGLWHKGTINGIFGVGLFFGIVIILGQMAEPFVSKCRSALKINIQCFSYKLMRVVRTYIIFALGVCFFRQNKGFFAALEMLKGIFTGYNPWIITDGSLLGLGLDLAEWFVLLLSIMVICFAGIVRYKTNMYVREWLSQQNIVFNYLVWLGIIAMIILFGWYGEGYTTQAFIYQQF